MGREAIVEIAYGDRRGQARALLEGDALILRKPIGISVPRAALLNPRVEGDALVLDTPDGPLSMTLGSVEAQRWAKAIRTPPPTLAAKLGLGTQGPVWLQGDFATPELSEALRGVAITAPNQAAFGLARVENETDLYSTLVAFGAAPGPLWIIHGKGKAAFGDAAVRALMREHDWIDTKACAVSQTLSATRYGRRKG